MQTFLFEHQRNENPLSQFTTVGGYPTDTRTVKQLTYQGSVTWTEALGDFLDFLTGIYGHDIKSQVHIGEFAQLQDLIQNINPAPTPFNTHYQDYL